MPIDFEEEAGPIHFEPEHDAPGEVPPMRGKSSYEGVPEWKLNLLQRAEKKTGEWGLIKPGMEMFSPSSLEAKKKALLTGANDLTLGYLPNAVAAAKSLSVSSPDYVKERDALQKYLDEAGPGEKMTGHALSTMAMMGIPVGKAKEAARLKEPILKSFARTVGTGAGLSAAANPGNVEGQVTPLQIPERVKNAKTGALVSGVLAAPGAAVRALRERLAAQPAKNAQEVIDIAKKIGVSQDEIPTELLTSEQTVRDKAAALRRDPTLGGEIVRRKQQPFQDTLQNTAEGFVADAHPASETGATVGTRVRAQIPDEVEKKLAPARAAYEELAGPMEKATPRGNAMKSGTTRLSGELAPRDSEGALRAIVDREKQHFLDNVKTVADLKQYRTDVGNRARDLRSQGDTRTAAVYDNLYDILTRERDRSLERSLIESGRKIGGKALAQQQVEKLRAADKLYGDTVRQTMSALGAETSRRTTPGNAVKDFLSEGAVDALPDRLWAGKNSEQAASFGQAFPAQAEDVRKLQLQRVAKAASKGPELSPTALNTQLERMTPETQGRLLGPNAKVLPDYRKLMKAMPDPNFNPSQTNIRSETLRNLNPWKQAGSVAGAAELNLRRPLPFVKEQGVASALTRNAGQTARISQSAQNFSDRSSPEKVLPRVAGTPFAGALAKASERGPDSYASTYFLLHQSYPEFREAVEKDEESQ